ncbi:MAG: heme ABC transporter ATP-binding protein [Tabrizicola sp.]|uniref:heme ABC transporter ATP-binding protein n=1 Tax=Tabrizicola sp. TaxID=2005166 RepID=UPI002AB83D31|nr:heme ABC transporter ATP-binding protein [Tabrizicola sp.]MDZ4088078.1 heme ABC transporter ATP-binding protein [Tabrizicola sp.]
MLELINVAVHLGRRELLQDITLSVRAGQLLAICGANGAGKSTLLKAILGELPATGRVRLNGFDVARTKPDALSAIRAVLPQDTEVAFGFSLGEIVRMGREAGDVLTRPDVEALALAAVGLRGREADDFRTLSGGERQRGHLARALAQVWEPVGPNGPRWLMLDEPVASLDLGHQLQAMRLARSYADAGGGVVAIMHDLNLSAMFADRMAFLIDGRLASIGTPSEVMQPDLLEAAYGCRTVLNTGPADGPWLVPQSCRELSQVAVRR